MPRALLQPRSKPREIPKTCAPIDARRPSRASLRRDFSTTLALDRATTTVAENLALGSCVSTLNRKKSILLKMRKNRQLLVALPLIQLIDAHVDLSAHVYADPADYDYPTQQIGGTGRPSTERLDA